MPAKPLPCRPAILAATILAAACGAESESAPAADQASPVAIAAPATGAAGPAVYSGPAMSKEELVRQVCFFTPEEIAAKLGFTVTAGKSDTAMLAYGSVSCIYDGRDNSLRVSAMWLDPAQVAGTRAGMTRMSGGGRTEAIPDDPDSAYFHDQQDNGTSLHYLRQNVLIQLQSTSGRTPFAVMKPRLLALRRVP